MTILISMVSNEFWGKEAGTKHPAVPVFKENKEVDSRLQTYRGTH